jgi:hypothetical protein
MNTARVVKKLNEDRVLFKLDPPINTMSGLEQHAYILLSHIKTHIDTPRTHMFPADEHGTLLNVQDIVGPVKEPSMSVDILINSNYKLIYLL